MSAGARAADWAGFYDRETLVYWSGQTPPGIEENFHEVVWPILTPEEKRSLAGIALVFPLEDGSHPMNFYASSDGAKKTITLPISSLRFFGDIALAYAWLYESGYSLEPITDYLAMLKYQWHRGLLAGRQYKPREVLGIPADATANARVASQFQNIFGTTIVFVLGHELGHLYHKHELTKNRERSRQQEEEADRFGLEIMRRIAAAPVGMVQYFTILALLEPYKSDPDYIESSNASTHPVTSSRLRAIGSGLRSLAPDFTRTGTRAATLEKISTDVETLIKYFDDDGTQDVLRRIGLAAKPELLGPRKPGAKIVVAPRAEAQPRAPFSGQYRGKWLDAKGIDFEVTMNLTRQGDTVRGMYSFGVGDVDVTTNVTIDGIVGENELVYSWKWGTEYFGKGRLRSDAKGHGLIGTWGYTQAESGAGTWELSPAE